MVIYVACHLKITFNLPTANAECVKHKTLLISLQLSWFGRYKSINVNGRDKAVHKSVCLFFRSFQYNASHDPYTSYDYDLQP